MTSTFANLGLREELLAALTHAGYSTPTPIQAQAIGPALKGRNILGLAQTGTGKTAAFALPILQHLASAPPPGRAPRALILAPTRELAIQILESVRGYGNSLRLRSMLIVGGASQGKQVNDLKRGVDIIIATPGRLEDLQKQRLIDLSHINHFVLDEADRMLDIGFFPSIRRIAATLPKQKQVLFFSATMPAQVAELAKQLLHDPVRVEVAPESTPVERITQQVIFVPQGEKRQVLIDLLADAKLYRVVVFTRTKHGADKVARTLERAGEQVSVMHGNKSQNARQAALGDFERGKVRLLVATDVAARGIDVDDVTHVINFDIPNEPETYVHRIGRTARAGKSGIAISLCDNGEEKSWLRDIEKLTRQKIPAQERPPASGYKIPPPTPQDNARPERRPQGPQKPRATAKAKPVSRPHARPDGQKPQNPHNPNQPKKPGNWQKRKRVAQGKGRPQPRG